MATLGFTGIGGQREDRAINAKFATRIATGGGGFTAYKGYVYLDTLLSAGTCPVRIAIYDHTAADSGRPDQVVGVVSNEVVIPQNQAASWIEFIFGTPVVLAASTTYYLAYHRGAGGIFAHANVSSIGDFTYDNATDTYADGTGAFGIGGQRPDRKDSIYIDDTPPVGGPAGKFGAQIAAIVC